MNTRQWMILPQTRKDAWWLWTGLQAEIRLQCEMLLDSEHFESSLPALQPGDVLSYAQPWFERIMLAFRCGEDSADYDMNVVFDPDFLSVRFAINNEPRGHELLIVRRNRESVFMDEQGFLLSGDEAAKHIARSLLVGWWPASSDTAVAA
jgi:hypothetical protein